MRLFPQGLPSVCSEFSVDAFLEGGRKYTGTTRCRGYAADGIGRRTLSSLGLKSQLIVLLICRRLLLGMSFAIPVSFIRLGVFSPYQ